MVVEGRKGGDVTNLCKPRVDRLEGGGLDVCGSDDLCQLRLLHLELLVDRLQPPLQEHALEASLLLHVIDRGLKLLIQVVALALDLEESLL